MSKDTNTGMRRGLGPVLFVGIALAMVGCGDAGGPTLPGSGEAPALGGDPALDPSLGEPSIGDALDANGELPGDELRAPELPAGPGIGSPRDPWEPIVIDPVGEPAPDEAPEDEDPTGELPEDETPGGGGGETGPEVPNLPPLLGSGEVVWTERMDTPELAQATVEMLEGEERCAPVFFSGACAMVVCEEAEARRVDAGRVVVALGDDEHDAEPIDHRFYALQTEVSEPGAPIVVSLSEGELLGDQVFSLGNAGRPHVINDAFIAGQSVAAALEAGEALETSGDAFEVLWNGYKQENGFLRIRLQDANHEGRFVECRYDAGAGEGAIAADALDQLGANELLVSMSSVEESVARFSAQGRAYEVTLRNERVLFDGLPATRE
ncbi:MAG: hypothetical protein AAGH15_15755 [Myxococcota bacterium]